MEDHVLLQNGLVPRPERDGALAPVRREADANGIAEPRLLLGDPVPSENLIERVEPWEVSLDCTTKKTRLFLTPKRQESTQF